MYVSSRVMFVNTQMTRDAYEGLIFGVRQWRRAFNVVVGGEVVGSAGVS